MEAEIKQHSNKACKSLPSLIAGSSSNNTATTLLSPRHSCPAANYTSQHPLLSRSKEVIPLLLIDEVMVVCV
jgi:hypothetical protein